MASVGEGGLFRNHSCSLESPSERKCRATDKRTNESVKWRQRSVFPARVFRDLPFLFWVEEARLGQKSLFCEAVTVVTTASEAVVRGQKRRPEIDWPA